MEEFLLFFAKCNLSNRTISTEELFFHCEEVGDVAQTEKSLCNLFKPGNFGFLIVWIAELHLSRMEIDQGYSRLALRTQLRRVATPAAPSSARASQRQ